MKTISCLLVWLLATSVQAAVPVPQEDSRFLGDAPTWPATEQFERLQLARPAIVNATGYSVTTTNREEVRSFFNTVFQASEGALSAWTGDESTCLPGTTASAYQNETARRINYFRAMAGLPAAIAFDPNNNTEDQQAALMMSANGQLNHFPPTNWICYTDPGANAAHNSNIAIGNAGPDAISAYIQDFGSNNTAAGHRRWLLYPQTQTMGTGDIPASDVNESANATWVFDSNLGGPRPAVRDNFVSWPPPGFVPYQIVWPRWSFAYPGADFTSTTVSLSTNGIAIPVTLETLSTGVGEPTLVWYPSDLNPNAGFNWPRPATDTAYQVTLQNVVINSVPQTFHYAVTVFDPSVAGPDTVLPAITGPDTPAVNQTNLYTFIPVPLATGYEWHQALRSPFATIDGAENGLTFFTSNVSTGYDVIVNSPVASGSAAFHLAQPVAIDQILTDIRVLLPDAGSQLQFKSRLGWATSGQIANVQISVNEGDSWDDLYSQPGTGDSGENSFITRTCALSNYAGRAVMVRFRYAYTGGSFFPQTTSGIGWYIDDISFANTEELSQSTNMTVVAGTAFDFIPGAATNYALTVRAQVYDGFHLDWGPVKSVTAGAPVRSNSAPIAVCQTVTINAGVNCATNVPASAFDGGSSDPDGDPLTFAITPTGPYPRGAQTVVLTVSDNHGASATCTTLVTVVDQTPPALACTNLTAIAPAGQTNVVVNFPAFGTDNCGLASVDCIPASGTLFAIGTTPVNCTAIDVAGNTNTCTFKVIITAANVQPHDLAVTKLTAPKKITLSSKVPTVISKFAVSIQNLGPAAETIPDLATLENLVTLTAHSLGTCADILPQPVTTTLRFPLLAPKKSLALSYVATFDCVNDPLTSSKTAMHSDYRVTAQVNAAALGGVDTVPANDVCPRPPNPATGDKGCDKGIDVLTDVVLKP